MSPQTCILLVDDEAAIIENLAPFLERSGFQVITASNGEEAIAEIQSESPELVVSDVLMPKMDGRELLRTLRRADNWIPVILLTQVGEAFERAMALEEGAEGAPGLAGGDRKARPPAPREGPRSLQFPRRGRGGARVLAP
jgi:CheY-like chemotaxis protein